MSCVKFDWHKTRLIDEAVCFSTYLYNSKNSDYAVEKCSQVSSREHLKQAPINNCRLSFSTYELVLTGWCEGCLRINNLGSLLASLMGVNIDVSYLFIDSNRGIRVNSNNTLRLHKVTRRR